MGDMLEFSPRYYRKLLERLRKQEQDMGPNPLTRDWFRIRNKIRAVERKLREVENDTFKRK